MRRTFSSCCSSPRVKLSISSALLSSTVPFVSVWAMSSAVVKTTTFAFLIFLTIPAAIVLDLGDAARGVHRDYLLVLYQRPYRGLPCYQQGFRP